MRRASVFLVLLAFGLFGACDNALGDWLATDGSGSTFSLRGEPLEEGQGSARIRICSPDCSYYDGQAHAGQGEISIGVEDENFNSYEGYCSMDDDVVTCTFDGPTRPGDGDESIVEFERQ
ncbi:MAG: hypothetical protein U0271_04875 [Polyangiaceae bacterium]